MLDLKSAALGKCLTNQQCCKASLLCTRRRINIWNIKKKSFQRHFVDIKLTWKTGTRRIRKQTFESLKPCMVNEMTEALAGIDLYTQTGNAENL